MGHVCYVCKKELKRIWNTKWEKSDVEKEQLPPTGMTSEDRLCSDCYDQCPKLDSDVALERMKLDSLPEGITSQQCDWCQKEIEINQMELPPHWIQNEQDHCQCMDCGDIIENLTSTKLQELVNERDSAVQTMMLIYKQISDSATKSVHYFTQATPQQTSENNSIERHIQSLELKKSIAKQEITRYELLILNEQIVLAKKYFSNTDSNEPETKVGSPNIMKPDVPVEILKVRLAKGEISLEEFNKIKKHLE
jgi:hypothetical protein